ncbi:hypothetical protein JZ751_008620 [Albula glossodonta]|uniref:Uncharacterized protein n=1 Tax=Albula glossodonta TaxID=121402 RepID=A0A8T2P156_9TELE|nr:hypothetical protein JZ751_008620 [Albula glossodonta]
MAVAVLMKVKNEREALDAFPGDRKFDSQLGHQGKQLRHSCDDQGPGVTAQPVGEGVPCGADIHHLQPMTATMRTNN